MIFFFTYAYLFLCNGLSEIKLEPREGPFNRILTNQIFSIPSKIVRKPMVADDFSAIRSLLICINLHYIKSQIGRDPLKTMFQMFNENYL